MVGYGGIRDQQHVWKHSTRESGDPVSSLTKGNWKEGGVNEGENPKN